MKNFDMRITLGNLITLFSMALGGFWVIAELRGNDSVTNTRLTHLEKAAERWNADHDIIIDMRADVKQMRIILERK